MSLSAHFRAAMKLDILDANYAFTSEDLGLSSPGHPLKRRRCGFLCGVFYLLGVAVKWSFLARLSDWRAPDIPRPVFFAETQNQLDALSPCVQKVRRPYLVLGVNLNPRDLEVDVHLPLGVAAWASLFFVPLVAWRWLHTRGYARLSFSHVFHMHCLAYAMYAAWRHFFASGNASCLIVANDHNMHTRVAMKAAREFGVATIYLQHASVTGAFPPLTMDYALLEGEDSVRKYRQAGRAKATVYMVGMAKSDSFVLRSIGDAESIGLCVNAFDTITDVDRLCAALTRDLPGRDFYLRPHPGSERNVFARLSEVAAKYDWRFSDSRVDGVADFLKQVGVVVAGDSSVHLEAVLCGIESLYYTGDRPPLDPYEYSRNGLVGPPLTDVAALVSAIRSVTASNAQEVRQRAKFYVDTVGTRHDGASASLIASLLEQICTNGEIRHDSWQEVRMENDFAVWRVV